MAGSPDAGSSDSTDPEPAGNAARDVAKPRGGMRMAVGVFGLFVVAGAIALPRWLSSPDTVAGFIQSALKGAESDVSVEKVRIGWFGPTVIEGITFLPRDGSPQPVSIARVEGERGLLAMLMSMGELGEFRVSGLEVDVVFDEDRQSNLQALAAKPTDDGSGGGPGSGGRESPVSTGVGVDQAVVRISGPWTDEPWVSEPIDIDLVLEPDPGQNRSRWRVGQVQLLNEAVLDPTVSQGVLAYIAPILADATIVGGRFSLSLESASLPVGDPGAGTVEGRLVMHAVDIGPGELVKNIMTVVPIEKKPQRSNLRISESSDIHFALADRRVSHEGLTFGVPLPKSDERLDIESAGSVGLDDRSLQLKLSLPLPKEMPADRPMLKALAGKKLGLSIGGTLDKPEVDMDGTLRSTVEGIVGRLPGRAAGASTDGAGAGGDAAGETAGPPRTSSTTKLGAVGTAVAEQIRGQLPPDAVDPETADAVVDLVGGILDEVGKRRAARQAAEKNAPASPQEAKETQAPGGGGDAAKPGRTGGGLLRRILDRVDEATAPQPAEKPGEQGAAASEPAADPK